MLMIALGWFATFGVGVLGLLILSLCVAGIVDVARRPDFDGRKRAAWILMIVLLPIAGTIAYFVTRPTLPRERKKIIAAQMQRRR
jgi:hypothetical protein